MDRDYIEESNLQRQHLFTEEDIRELMFELTPSEITEKIMNVNAYNFIRRNIANMHKDN